LSREINTFRPYENLEAAISGTEAPKEITDQLALVPVDFFTFDAAHATGQLVVASELAGEVQEIFGRIRDGRFPIRSIIPIEFFGWDDHASISAGNTSAYNYRLAAGEDVLSVHSWGRAIDINPDLNPYEYSPEIDEAARYLYSQRNTESPGTIAEGDVVTRAFYRYGWFWGGRWPSPDYQHFEKSATLDTIL
jgi:hypothetical protein